MPAILARTLQAMRQLAYATLTTPLITYNINNGAPITLQMLDTQTIPQPHYAEKGHLWSQGFDPPSPLIEYQVTGRGRWPRQLPPGRLLALKIWVSSTLGSDECSEIAEVIGQRFAWGDQDAVYPASNLSRLAGGSTLPIVVQECVEGLVMPAAYEKETSRYYCSVEYRIRAL